VEKEMILVLIDEGVTHNLINKRFVAKKRIKDEPFSIWKLVKDISPYQKLMK